MSSADTYVPAWAERVASGLGPGPHVVVTGISPSGNIHAGNLREVLVAEAVANALKAGGEEVRFVFHADTIDPLRKIAPGVPKDYERYLGHSLSRVPDPEGCHASYAEHFLEPFEGALGKMGMEVEVLRSHELYEGGVYADVTQEALKRTDDLRGILQEISGRKMPEHWSPYLPRASSGRLGGRVLEHLPEQRSVLYEDEDGREDSSNYGRGEGKLGWRVELAARWKALRATFEPFGKDHTSRGGSTDTADRMAREVFDYPVPGRYEYEWIQIKGRGAMSSSKGIVLLPNELLEIMPPGTVRRLILGRDPARALDLDLAEGFPRFMDEYLAEVEEGYPPFNHLVTVAQTAGGNVDAAVDMLLRGGYGAAARDRNKLAEYLSYARNWAKEWAPEPLRLGLLELPEAVEAAESLDEDQLRYLEEAAGSLESGMEGDVIQNVLYAKAKELGLKPKKAFEAIYTVLLGKKSGPRVGPFVASLGVWLVRERFLREPLR